jgi:hypothetical protein
MVMPPPAPPPAMDGSSDVAAGYTDHAATNLQSAGAVIHGANNDDTIYLGTGLVHHDPGGHEDSEHSDGRSALASHVRVRTPRT